MLYNSGARLREGSTLLTIEMPEAGHRPSDRHKGYFGAKVCKWGRGRPFFLDAATMSTLRTYEETWRSAAVSRAWRDGRYERLPDLLLVTRISGHASARKLEWVDRNGEIGRGTLDVLDASVRQRLYKPSTDADGVELRAEDGRPLLEPLYLWLNEDGLPKRAWGDFFRDANVTVAAAMNTERPAHITAQALRHSFALRTLITIYEAALNGSWDQADRWFVMQRMPDPFKYVRDLLGHRDEATTVRYYVTPLADLLVDDLYQDAATRSNRDHITADLYARAMESGRVHDADDRVSGLVAAAAAAAGASA